MEGRSGVFGRVLHVDHQLHPAGGDGAGAGGRGGLLRLGSEQLRSPPSTASSSPASATRTPPHARMSGSHSLGRGLSLMRTPGGGHDHPPGAPSSSPPTPRHPPLGLSRGSMRVPVEGEEGGVGSRWHRRRRNRARPRHRRCQGGCRALGGVGRGVCSPGWGLCSAPPLHASLCVVVNMRGGHNNMCNIVSVAREWCTGSASILFIRARCSLPGGGGLGPDFGGSGPVLRLQLRNSQPLGRFVTAAHLHRLGFAPFFFLPVQA